MASALLGCPASTCSCHSSRVWSRTLQRPNFSRSARPQRPCRGSCRRSVQPCQAIFGFGNKKEAPATSVAEKRDFYSAVDVEHYFNYMGMLADEGTYERLDKLRSTGLEPVDLLLVMAAGENDAPKVGELIRAGADIKVKGPEGKSPLELATSEEVLDLLQNPNKAEEMDFA